MTPDDATNDPFAFDAGAPHSETADPPAERPDPGENDPALAERVLEAMKTVFDPEIPVNIVDLGLIYDLVATPDGIVYVEMTLTTPACPVAGALPDQVKEAIAAVDGVQEARVNLVWSPPWTQDRLTEEAKLELGLV